MWRYRKRGFGVRTRLGRGIPERGRCNPEHWRLTVLAGIVVSRLFARVYDGRYPARTDDLLLVRQLSLSRVSCWKISGYRSTALRLRVSFVVAECRSWQGSRSAHRRARNPGEILEDCRVGCEILYPPVPFYPSTQQRASQRVFRAFASGGVA